MFKYKIDFIDGAKLHIDEDNDPGNYNVIIKDNDNNKIEFNKIIKPGEYVKTNKIYYKNWNIIVRKSDKKLLDYNIDLKNKTVLIKFDSKSLGDSLAWIPYVEEFRKKHGSITYVSTFNNYLFKDKYPDLIFVEPGTSTHNLFAKYNIGWYKPQKDKNPHDYRKIPLQKTATDILGLEYKEIIPKINKPENLKKPYNNKYVCIAQYSTANTKHWHYPFIDSNKGWQILVDWLNKSGYKVLVISKQGTNLKNVVDRTGDYPLEWRIHELINCDFFIGVGSGLSWLAWALGKKVVMISGFSDPVCEFKSNNIRIMNENVCNSCFNKFEFDRGDWNWCPVHKYTKRQFECTKNITPKMVAESIIKEGLVSNINFNFNIVDDKIKINENDIKVEYKNNRINIHYSGESLNDIHIDIINDMNKTVKRFRNIQMINSQIIWTSFPLNSDYFYIDIFTDFNPLIVRKYLNIK